MAADGSVSGLFWGASAFLRLRSTHAHSTREWPCVRCSIGESDSRLVDSYTSTKFPAELFAGSFAPSEIMRNKYPSDSETVEHYRTTSAPRRINLRWWTSRSSIARVSAGPFPPIPVASYHAARSSGLGLLLREPSSTFHLVPRLGRHLSLYGRAQVVHVPSCFLPVQLNDLAPHFRTAGVSVCVQHSTVTLKACPMVLASFGMCVRTGCLMNSSLITYACRTGRSNGRSRVRAVRLARSADGATP